MKHDIAALKQQLPLDALLRKLGHPELVKRQCLCPFHQDTRHSFSVWQNGAWHWNCFSGCGSGDEVSFIQKFFDLPDFKSALKRYADIAGNPIYDEVRKFQGSVRPKCALRDSDETRHKSMTPSPRPAKLEPLTDAAAAQIAAWRGLEPAFVKQMSDRGILGLYDGKPAFATEGGVQYRVPNDGWRFSSGAKNSVLVLGSAQKFEAHIVESNWDALALYEADDCAQVICTRGAANARLAIDYIDKLSGGESMNVTIIPQNDAAADKWLQDLKAGLMLHSVTVKRVPKQYKDFNELTKARKQLTE